MIKLLVTPLFQKNIKKAVLLTMFAVAFILTKAQTGIKAISEDSMKSHLEFLASDSLQGRSFGTEIPGLDIAADYIAAYAKKTGLTPAFPDFVQQVPIISTEPDKKNTKLTFRENGNTVLKTDSLIGFFRNNENTSFKGEVVFAGFAWQDSTKEYNDFKGLDLHGKIVMYVTGSPSSFKEEPQGENMAFNNRFEQAKWDKIMELGAKGIIVIPSPLDKNQKTYTRIHSWMGKKRYSLTPKNHESTSINAVLATNHIFDALVGEPGALLKELKSRVKSGESQHLFPDNLFAEIQITTKIVFLEGKNIVGFAEGSDPELKNECVVFMAHYDHLGVSPEGDVFNGADDNGSGTVTLMELAKAFMSLKEKPARSIVFLWVTCEEKGLFGSNYYTGHPAFPINKTIACINLDMVGRVYEKADEVWKKSPKKVKKFKGLYTLSGEGNPWLLEISDAACKKVGLKPDKSLPSHFLRSSDHYYFYEKGVPVLNYATGYHADYHKATDEVEKINFKKMKKVAELCFLVGYKTANLDK